MSWNFPQESQIEWMREKLMRSFEGARNNPFRFRHVQICHRLACPENTSLILTSKTSTGTPARILMDDPTPKLIEVEVKQRVKLEGLELEVFYRQQREKKYRVKKEKREAIMDSDDSDDSDKEIKITENIPFFFVSTKRPNMMSTENLLELTTSSLAIMQWRMRRQEIPEYPRQQWGRSDGESIRKIVEQVKPRRLIVYTPCVGNVVDVTTESHIYQKDSLVSSLDMKRGRDAELAWIDAYFLMEEEKMEVEAEIPDDDAKIIKSEPEISQLVPTLGPITDMQV
ncbi:unnamed protein product [Allacma fusca]|uniref:Cleavage and polyadenylation specificity factor subunit 2 n=2 Tax=Allacma fusca TaxID=39272 RepID=A0A8J2JF66_9HEXA|nr:unnamed protein product [Allacma fusca]